MFAVTEVAARRSWVARPNFSKSGSNLATLYISTRRTRAERHTSKSLKSLTGLVAPAIRCRTSFDFRVSTFEFRLSSFDFRVSSFDFRVLVLAFLRLELRNRHRLVSELDPTRRLIRQGVFQPVGIVALGQVLA